MGRDDGSRRQVQLRERSKTTGLEISVDVHLDHAGNLPITSEADRTSRTVTGRSAARSSWSSATETRSAATSRLLQESRRGVVRQAKATVLAPATISSTILAAPT